MFTFIIIRDLILVTFYYMIILRRRYYKILLLININFTIFMNLFIENAICATV